MSAWGAIVEKAFYNNKGIAEGNPNVIIYTATPNAAVTAKVGTLCWDKTNSDAYINTDGSTTWVKINA